MTIALLGTATEAMFWGNGSRTTIAQTAADAAERDDTASSAKDDAENPVADESVEPAPPAGEKLIGAEIRPSELPRVPPTIQRLMRRGQITFRYGPAEDPRRISRFMAMAAETKYRIEFQYDSSLRWRRVGREVVVDIKSLDVRWQPRHTVWFRERPPTEDFWDNPLVRHELDHVEISSHPSLEQTFRRRAGEIKQLVGEIRPGESSRTAAQRLVRRRLTSLFDEVSDLARIRYIELDQQTRHGLEPLPGHSALTEYLTPRSKPEAPTQFD